MWENDEAVRFINQRSSQNANRLQLKWVPPKRARGFTCLFSVRRCFNRSVYKHLSSLTCCFLSCSAPELQQKHEASVLQGHAKKKMEELQSRAESAQTSLDKAGF